MNYVQAESRRRGPKGFKISFLSPKIQSKLDLKLVPCSRAAYGCLSQHFRNSASSATFDKYSKTVTAQTIAHSQRGMSGTC